MPEIINYLNNNNNDENNKNDLPGFLTPNELKFIKKYNEFKKNHKLKEPDTPFLKNLKIKIDSITQERIAEVKKELQDYLIKNRSGRNLSDRFVEELSLDNYVKGYIARDHKNVVEKIVDAMEYLSKTDGINDETFPKEFLEFGVNISSGFDIFGNPVLYMFAKRNFIPSKLYDAFETYTAYLIYQLVRISMFTNGYFTMLFDFTGAGVQNVDFTALRCLIRILNDYAPLCLNRIIIYNMHWALKPAFRLGNALLPSNVGEIMCLVNGKQIEKFINSDQLSTFIDGGLNHEIILGKPKKNGMSFLEITEKFNIPVEEAKKMIEKFRGTLKKKNLELLSFE